MSRKSLILLISLTLGGPLFAGTWHVSSTGSDNASGASEADGLATVSQAIALAADADSILIHSGSYTETVQLNSSSPENLSFMAAPADGGYEAVEIMASSNKVFHIQQCPGVTLEGLQLLSSQYGVYAYRANGLKLKQCTISGHSAKGLFLDNQTAHEGSLIESCTFQGNGNYAIYMQRAGSMTAIRDNLITDNGGGIYLNNNQNAGIGAIAGNQILANGNHGLYLYRAGICRVDSNLVAENNGIGIYVNNNNYSVSSFSDNVVRDNSSQGMYIRSFGNCQFLSRNRLMDNGASGIQVDSNSGNPIDRIDDNVASGNAGYGLYFNQIGDCQSFKGDSVAANNNWGIYIQSAGDFGVIRDLDVRDNTSGMYVNSIGSCEGLVASVFSGNGNHSLYYGGTRQGLARLDSLQVDSSDRGIYLNRPGPMQSIRWNTITFTQNGSRGIFLNNNDDEGITLVEHNLVSNSHDHAIYLAHPGTMNSLSHNTVTQCAGSGIYVNNNSGLAVTQITDNQITSNGIGLYLNSAQVDTIQRNTVDSYNDWAFYLSNNYNSGLQFKHNTSSASARGVYMSRSGAMECDSNTVVGTNTWAFQLESLNGVEVRMRGNVISNTMKGVYLNSCGDLHFNSNSMSGIAGDWALSTNNSSADTSSVCDNVLSASGKGFLLHKPGSVFVSGNTLTGVLSDWSIYLNNLDRENYLISGNTISGAASAKGIYVYKGGNGQISDNLIQNCAGDWGVFVADQISLGLQFINNQILNCKHGIYMQRPGVCTVTDNVIEQIDSDWAFLLNNLAGCDLVMTDNTIQDVQRGAFIYDCGQLEFVGNTIRDSAQNWSLYYRGSNESTLISGNRIQEGTKAAYLERSGELEFSCNIIAGMSDRGVQIADQSSNQSLIYANTFHDNGHRHLETGRMQNGSICDNIFSSCGNTALQLGNPFAGEVCYNLYHNNNEDRNSQAESADSGGNIWGDPHFTDATAFDFTPIAGSPAIDSGNPALSDPDGSAADMGAHVCHVTVEELFVEILAPGDGDETLENETLTLEASMSGGLAPFVSYWASSLDGELGSGLVLDVGLSPGLHQLTIHVIDSRDVSTTARIEVNVLQQTVWAEEDVDSFGLQQNYPNPFNPATEVRFSLAQLGDVSVSVFNLQGARVADLVSERMEAGNHRIHFDASGLAAGIYICVLESSGMKDVRKMTLLK